MWKPYKVVNEFEITEFYSAFDRKCEEGFMFKGESHGFWEMVYVIDGNIIISADERVVKLSKNQILFHKPMEFHTLNVQSGDKAHIFVMSFSAKGSFMDNFERKIIRLKPERFKEVMGILEFLREYNHTKDIAPYPVSYLQQLENDRVFAQKLKNITETFLINVSTAQSEESLVLSSETRIYRDAMNIIDDSICENLTVEEIARGCNVSCAYLKRIFSKYAGIGVHNCVLKAKITYAKQLLDSGVSVSSVADRLSFSTANYFSIVFRRETGMSPTEYKKGRS